MGWQETGTPGAICYQIATNQVGHRGLSRGGSARFFMSASPDTLRRRFRLMNHTG